MRILAYMRRSILLGSSGLSHVSGVGFHRLSVDASGSWNNRLVTFSASSGDLETGSVDLLSLVVRF